MVQQNDTAIQEIKQILGSGDTSGHNKCLMNMLLRVEKCIKYMGGFQTSKFRILRIAYDDVCHFTYEKTAASVNKILVCTYAMFHKKIY